MFGVSLLTIAAAIPFTAADVDVKLTPWCDNSMRVRISPSTMPVSAQAAQVALSQVLAAKNMTDLAGALMDTCKPGTAVTSSRGKALTKTHGNLVATVDGNAVSFSRADTGAILFKAQASFIENTVAAGAEGGWTTLTGKVAPSCSGSEYVDALGSASSAAECLEKVVSLSTRANYAVWRGDGNKGCYICDLTDRGDPSTWKYNDVSGASCFVGPALPSVGAGYLTAKLDVTAGDSNEVIYGLGQGNWTPEGGCPARGLAGARIVPLERNGQSVNLMQRKFHISIPFASSTAGYGFLFNMPGYGDVTIGAHGVGGAAWSASAALYLDFWVTGLPEGVTAPAVAPIYKQYADATGHSPALREDAMLFWQSRNRYKSTEIALSVAQRYAKLKLPLGVLVVDYKNQVHDGDFAPNPTCYPSVSNLSKSVRAVINATTMFSFWPEVQRSAAEYGVLKSRGCLINRDLGGLAVDATKAECRDFIWNQFLKPRYYDQGVDSYWLDETDAEGTGGGPDGNFGYNTSWGPPAAYSNLWVNDWLSIYSDPVAAQPGQIEPPLVLTRGTWAGGQRHGIVLWSSDIHSSYEQLASQVPQGVHASMSGIPWWTTDVGGYGCDFSEPNDSPYMQELMVRWYQFGCFSPVFRTHGCRAGASEPNTAACSPRQGSCGFNEVWSYGQSTQIMLEKYIRLRAELKPYIAELAINVTADGVPTMRPLAYEFPSDSGCRGINDQYMLGPELLVAPVTAQGATKRDMYFPAGADWKQFFTGEVIKGGQRLTVDAPLDLIPVYRRGRLSDSVLVV